MKNLGKRQILRIFAPNLISTKQLVIIERKIKSYLLRSL